MNLNEDDINLAVVEAHKATTTAMNELDPLSLSIRNKTGGEHIVEAFGLLSQAQSLLRAAAIERDIEERLEDE